MNPLIFLLQQELKIKIEGISCNGTEQIQHNNVNGEYNVVVIWLFILRTESRVLVSSSDCRSCFLCISSVLQRSSHYQQSPEISPNLHTPARPIYCHTPRTFYCRMGRKRGLQRIWTPFSSSSCVNSVQDKCPHIP